MDVDSSITNTTSAYGLQGSSVVVVDVVVVVVVVVIVVVEMVDVVVVVVVVVVVEVYVKVVVVVVVVVSRWQAVKLVIWLEIFSAAASTIVSETNLPRPDGPLGRDDTSLLKVPPTSQCRGSTSLGVLAIFVYK